MNNNKSDEFSAHQQELALYGKILSHPARIAIVQLLAQKKEIKTGNIHEYLPISRPTVSRHLKELKMMGIIRGSIDGQRIHYCLDMQKLRQMSQALHEFFEASVSDFICKCDPS